MIKLFSKPNDKELKGSPSEVLLEYSGFRYNTRTWYQLVTKGYFCFLPTAEMITTSCQPPTTKISDIPSKVIHARISEKNPSVKEHTEYNYRK